MINPNGWYIADCLSLEPAQRLCGQANERQLLENRGTISCLGAFAVTHVLIVMCGVKQKRGSGAPSFPRATDGKKANMSSMTRILAAHTPALQSRPRVRKRVLWLLPVFVLVNLVFFSRNNNQTPSAEKEGPLKRECCGCYGVIVVLRFQESRGVVPLHEILPSGLFKLLSYFTQ